MPNLAEDSDDVFLSNSQGDYVDGMFGDWFLDYASYVILERAVPHAFDGLKPVQRRILHSMRELEDGRYNKVANVIGNTMKYHPHGDASISDAMIQLGQKGLLIDMQGNWGNTLTGDSAAAAVILKHAFLSLHWKSYSTPKQLSGSLPMTGATKNPRHCRLNSPAIGAGNRRHCGGSVLQNLTPQLCGITGWLHRRTGWTIDRNPTRLSLWRDR